MASIGSLLVYAAVLVWTNAFNITKFEPFAPGVYDEWAKNSPDNVPDGQEHFGLVYGNAWSKDKLWLVTRRPKDGLPGSAVRGGMVSTFQDSQWSHTPYAPLSEDPLEERLFSSDGHLHMLTYSVDKAIRFQKLLAFDEFAGIWDEIKVDIKSDAIQELIRGKYLVSHIVADSDRVYLVATCHNLDINDSQSTFFELKRNTQMWTLKMIGDKLVGAKATAATSVIVDISDNFRLYVVSSQFSNASSVVAPVSVDYYLDTKTGERFETSPALRATRPVLDFTRDRTFIVDPKYNYGLFLGPRQDNLEGQDTQTRHMWLLNMDGATYGEVEWREADGQFPRLPQPTFAVDRVNRKIYTAGLKDGVFVATIDAPEAKVLVREPREEV